MGEVDRRVTGHKRVDVVAAHTTLHLGKARGDLAGLTRAKVEHLPQQGFWHAITGTGTEIERRAVGQKTLDPIHVVACRAIAQRAGATGIVADHAANGGARGGRDIDREPQAMRFECAVEIIQNDPRLDHRAPSRDIQFQNPVEVFRAVHDQAGVHRLPTLRRAAAAHRQRHTRLSRGVQCRQNIPRRLGQNHARWHDLIDRGIGGIAPAREGVKARFALHLAAEALLNCAVQHGSRSGRRSEFGLDRILNSEFNSTEFTLIRVC